MPFNINSFINNGLPYGGARPSQFSVSLSVPSGIGISNVSVSKFKFVCRAAEIPDSVISPIEVGFFGRKIKVAGDRTFSDWSVTIMNDEDYSVRSLFETWSNAINRHVSNVRDPSLSAEQYKQDLEVIQYGKDGNEIRSYIIVGAFPTQIGPMALDWESQNQIQTFTVNFSYDYWVPNIETSSKNAGGLNIYGSATDVNGSSGAF